MHVVLTGHIEFLLFMGRALQALASSIIWVLGFSTIADNVQSEHLGKSYGTVSMAVSVGTSAGPVLAGMLLELGGYWVAWSCAFSIIVLDIVLRLLMLERPHNTEAGECSSTTNYPSTGYLCSALTEATSREQPLEAPMMKYPTQNALLCFVVDQIPMQLSRPKIPVLLSMHAFSDSLSLCLEQPHILSSPVSPRRLIQLFHSMSAISFTGAVCTRDYCS